MKNIRWTDKQKEVAALLDQGKTRKEIMEAGYSRGIVDHVLPIWKALNKKVPKKEVSSTVTKPMDVIRQPVLDLVQVGGLYIEPANWRINQEGVYLIMNTHKKAKEMFGYEGSLGEFICDCVQAMRDLMGVDLMAFDYYLTLKEGDNGRGNEEGQGSGAGLLQEGPSLAQGDGETEDA